MVLFICIAIAIALGFFLYAERVFKTPDFLGFLFILLFIGLMINFGLSDQFVNLKWIDIKSQKDYSLEVDLSEGDINLADMLTKAKGNFYYTYQESKVVKYSFIKKALIFPFTYKDQKKNYRWTITVGNIDTK